MKIRIAVYVMTFLLAGYAAGYSFPNVSVDGMVGMTELFKTDGKFSAGAGLGFNITPEIMIKYRFLYSIKTVDPNLPTAIKYNRMDNSLGVEYEFKFWGPFSSITSLMVGFNTLNITFPGEIKKNDKAINGGLWTGLKYDATQHISPYVLVGYEYMAYQNAFLGTRAHNVELLIGVRFVIGSNKAIDADY